MFNLSKAVAAACCSAVLMLAALPGKAADLTDLPDISLLSPYAYFGGNLNLHNGQVYGDVALYDGVSGGADMNLPGASEIYGDLYLGTGVTYSDGTDYFNSCAPGETAPCTRTVTANLDLSAALAQLTTASSALAALTPDASYASITTGTNLGVEDGIANVQVFNVSSINLGSGENITFTGDAGDYYVLNIIDGAAGGGDAKLTMGGNARIGDGATAPYLLINMVDNDSWGQIAQINNYIYGTVLVPQGDVTTHGAFGAIYATNNVIKIQSDANLVNYDAAGTFTSISGQPGGTSYALNTSYLEPPPTGVTEPSSLLLAALALLVMAPGRVRHGMARFIRKAAAAAWGKQGQGFHLQGNALMAAS